MMDMRGMWVVVVRVALDREEIPVQLLVWCDPEVYDKIVGISGIIVAQDDLAAAAETRYWYADVDDAENARIAAAMEKREHSNLPYILWLDLMEDSEKVLDAVLVANSMYKANSNTVIVRDPMQVLSLLRRGRG